MLQWLKVTLHIVETKGFGKSLAQPISDSDFVVEVRYSISSHFYCFCRDLLTNN